MIMVGEVRYVYFRLADSSGNPVTGRVQSSFNIIFTRNNAVPPDTLTVSEIGGGRYYASYTPTTTGTDYVEIYDAPTNTRVVNAENVESPQTILGGSALVALTQDYPTAGALTVTQVSSPQTYTLYAFFYSDWQSGNQSAAHAQGQTGLNANGTWKTPIYLLAGTYTLMVTNGASSFVIAPHLTV